MNYKYLIASLITYFFTAIWLNNYCNFLQIESDAPNVIIEMEIGLGPVPTLAMTGIALSDSVYSVRFTWLYSFILHHYRGIVRDSVLMVACDRWGYCAPPVASGIVYKHTWNVVRVRCYVRQGLSHPPVMDWL